MTDPTTFAQFQDEAYRTVGAVWLDDGTLAGWQLKLDAEVSGPVTQAEHEADEDYAWYVDTQLGAYLSDEDEIMDGTE